MLHPRITKKLQQRLEALCSEHGVPVPRLVVCLARKRTCNGIFFKHGIKCIKASTIVIYNPDPWTRESTLNHEFTHYLDWLDGVRQGKDEAHADGFWERLAAVEHLDG
jgi:hypothetical protein